MCYNQRQTHAGKCIHIARNNIKWAVLFKREKFKKKKKENYKVKKKQKNEKIKTGGFFPEYFRSRHNY